MMKMLAREPAQRYQTAKAALRDLSRFLYGFRPDFFSGEVAEFMQLIFRDKITSSRERLRSTLALPVDAIGRATRGMDVVAPESAMSMVLDVSDHSQVGRAAGQNDAQAKNPAVAQPNRQQSPVTVRAPQRAAQQPASGDGVVQRAAGFYGNAAAQMPEQQGRKGGAAQAGRSSHPASSGPGSKDQNGQALSLNPKLVAKAGSDFQGQQNERSRVVPVQISAAQPFGQTAQVPMGRTVSRRVSVRAKQKGSPLLIVLVGIIIIAGVLVVALRRNDIPYTVDLEISTLPKVPFRFDVTGSNLSDTQMATSPVRFTLKGGDYDVKISRPGFQPQTFSVSTALFMRVIRKTIVMESEGPLGQLRLTTQPPGAKITSQDGYYSEVSPALISFLPLGKPLVFEIRHPKCQPAVYRETLPRSAEQSVLVRSLTLKGCE
jgi:hypothetical protein